MAEITEDEVERVARRLCIEAGEDPERLVIGDALEQVTEAETADEIVIADGEFAPAWTFWRRRAYRVLQDAATRRPT